MSVLLIGDVTSRLRGLIKGARQDAFLTDRFLFSIVSKHTKLAMKRLDEKSRLMGFNSIFQTLPWVELVETDRIAAGCAGIRSNVTFRRTKEPIPAFMEGYWGPLVRTVSSLDGAEELQYTTPTAYLNISSSKNFRYNKTKYFWFLDDHFYFPNTDWEAVRLEGVFEEDVSDYFCEGDEKCLPRQEQSFNVPDYILSEIEGNALKELGIFLQSRPDPVHDNQSPDN